MFLNTFFIATSNNYQPLVTRIVLTFSWTEFGGKRNDTGTAPLFCCIPPGRSLNELQYHHYKQKQ
jgi:hypothetical protein